MAFVEGRQVGTLPDATAVNLVNAPAAGTRRIVRTITISNNSGATLTLTISTVVGAISYTIWSGSLDNGDTWMFGDGGEVIVVDSNTTLVAQLSAIPAAPFSFVTSYGDAT